MTNPPRLIVRGERVLVEDRLQPAAIVIQDGRIVGVEAGSESAGSSGKTEGPTWLDAGDLVVFPGLVDAHVHCNEPGRTDWEGFATATRAAAAGGITALVDMPLNAVPATTTAAALRAKLEAAASSGLTVDVGFWGGIVPGNLEHLGPLAAGGVLGFKAFLVDSGVPEFPATGWRELERAARRLAELDLPLLVHAEDPDELLDPPAAVADSTGRADYRAYLDSRPAFSEISAIRGLLALAERTGVRLHVVHLAAPEALKEVQAAQRRDVAVTVETCPHYLTFAAEDVPDGGVVWKCAPPIRERSHRDALRRGLLADAIGLVGSDHSPAPPGRKRIEEGDFFAAWGGIASLQLLLPATWTAMRPLGCPPEALGRWLAARPASLAGLADRKGTIAEGRDADLVFWNPDRSFVVDGQRLEHRHPATPYEGTTLYGVVERTLVRGRTVFGDGSPRPATEPGIEPTRHGRVLLGRTALEDPAGPAETATGAPGPSLQRASEHESEPRDASSSVPACIDLAVFNRLDPETAKAGLLFCCGSTRWAQAMSDRRPYADLQDLRDAADTVWRSLDPADWLEAFAAHPRIGERPSGGAGWSRAEQAGALTAGEVVRQRLESVNREYEDHFGHVFLICATGRSGKEMLAEAERRLANPPEEELAAAAREQSKITALRLEKWIRK